MKYSIIIPTHNNEHTIETAINSILMQSVKDYEIIVVDDASTDNTNKILKQIESDKHIKVINLEKNIKAGGARNKGIDIAKGEYIIFLDSDDVLENGALEKINNILGDDKPDIIYLGFRTNNELEVIPNEENSVKRKRLSEWKYENVWDICWNKDFLNKNNIRFIEDRYFEDFLFYYKGVILSETYKFLPDITHIYIENRSGSITTDISLKKLEDLYNNTTLLIKFMNTIEEQYKECLLDGVYRNNNYINRLIYKYKSVKNND